MNLYFLVEGDVTEKLVYRAWLGHALPQLVEVDSPTELKGNAFFIVSGRGYPSYLERIRSSHEDIRDNPAVDHFFVCIDSEESSFEEKLAEVESELEASAVETRAHASNHRFRSHVIVQHCCMETWFLGNERLMPAQPEGEILRRYREFYGVRRRDPEEMPCHRDFPFRAQFHLAYLKELFRARGPRLRYSKNRPEVVTEQHYYEALVARVAKNHLASFRRLLGIWRELANAPPSRDLRE